MTHAQTNRRAAHNKRLAQWREKWLIEHSSSHQQLWYIDSQVLRNPPLCQATKLCSQYRKTDTQRREQQAPATRANVSAWHTHDFSPTQGI